MSSLRARAEPSAVLGYAAVFRRRKAIIIVTTAAALALMTAYVLNKTPVYQANAHLQLTPAISAAALQATSNAAAASPTLVDVPTAIEVMESSAIYSRVAAEVPHAPAVSVSQIGTTDVVTVSVRSPDPKLAAAAANAYARQYVSLEQSVSSAALQNAIGVLERHVGELQQTVQTLQTQAAHVTSAAAQSLQAQIAALAQSEIQPREELTVYQTAAALTTGGGKIVGNAVVPSSPVLPKPVEYLVLAAIVGVFIGAALAVLRDRLDDHIRTPEDLEPITGAVPTLGAIPTFEAGDQGLVTRERPGSPPAEAYRILAASVQFLQAARHVKVIQITSPRPGDGKSTTLANLAVAMSQAGKRVLAVDCDLRLPRLHKLFGVPHGLGLASVLLGQCAPSDAIFSAPGMSNLDILPAGHPPPFPTELLSGDMVRTSLLGAADGYDVLLIDSPPILPVADAALLASHVDATMLIVGTRISTRRDVSAAMRNAQRVEAPLLGFVLNRTETRDQTYYSYYGYGTDRVPTNDSNDAVPSERAVPR